jgi:hypothetical protein
MPINDNPYNIDQRSTEMRASSGPVACWTAPSYTQSWFPRSFWSQTRSFNFTCSNISQLSRLFSSLCLVGTLNADSDGSLSWQILRCQATLSLWTSVSLPAFHPGSQLIASVFPYCRFPLRVAFSVSFWLLLRLTRTSVRYFTNVSGVISLLSGAARPASFSAHHLA